MKRLLVLVATGLLLVGFQGKATALSFVLGGYDVVLNEGDPGLKLSWNPILTTPAVLNVDEGKTSNPFALFRLQSDETVVNWDDLWPKDIYVSFDFSSPEVSNGIGGWTRGRLLFNDGVVRWDGPTDFYFGDTGHFRIDLLDAAFDLPGSTQIMATITCFQADTAVSPVPEPASVFMMGLGLLILVGLGRRRLLMK